MTKLTLIQKFQFLAKIVHESSDLLERISKIHMILKGLIVPQLFPFFMWNFLTRIILSIPISLHPIPEYAHLFCDTF